MRVPGSMVTTRALRTSSESAPIGRMIAETTTGPGPSSVRGRPWQTHRYFDGCGVLHLIFGFTPT